MSSHIDSTLDEYIKKNKFTKNKNPDKNGHEWTPASPHDRRYSGEHGENHNRRHKHHNDKGFERQGGYRPDYNRK